MSVGGWWWYGEESPVYCSLKMHLLCSWFYSKIVEAGLVQDSTFLFLTLIKGKRRFGREVGEFKIFLHVPRDGKILL